MKKLSLRTGLLILSLGLIICGLFITSAYSQQSCTGVFGPSGNHSFNISGRVMSVTTVGSNTWVSIDTNIGPGFDIYNVKCGNGASQGCSIIAISLAKGSIVDVTMSGPIVLQSCPSGIQHSVIFRAESIFF